MIQLGLTRFLADVNLAALNALKAEFAEFHTLQLRGFLDRSLFDFVSRYIPDSEFKPRPHGKIAMELAVDRSTNIGIQTLQLRMNDRGLCDFIEQVTDTRPLLHFAGRAYRMSPGTDHYDSWHDDIVDGRRIGVSINLSQTPYQGGVFVLRRVTGEQVIRPMPNLGPGDAIFFRIADDLQHMVTRMEGTTSKTAFAGWFHDHDTLADFLRRPAVSEVTT